jgi:CheY-like chemotaxis protein
MQERSPQAAARLNLLLTQEQQAPEHWSEQLPRLLETHGIRPYRACTGQEAYDLAGQVPIHAALVDLATPPDEQQGRGSDRPGGLWLLEVMRRMPEQPPTVVINNRAYSERQLQRLMNQALRLGAFSVVNRPRDLESLLAIIQRVVDRRYEGRWPGRPRSRGQRQASWWSSMIRPRRRRYPRRRID